VVYYDDNFGQYDIRDDDDVAFYHQVQAESRLTRCSLCHKEFMLRPNYSICNNCADSIERGGDPYCMGCYYCEDESETEIKE